MKNELEEGTFDENGMYLFKNNKVSSCIIL